MKILLLGTGTPNPSLERMGAGHLVAVGDEVLIFDHGPGAYHRLLESGISPTRVTHLFFSHLHYDHCLDYARLVLTRWDQGAGNIPDLKVYGPAFTLQMTSALLGKTGAFGPDIDARVNHQPSVDTYFSRGGVLPRRPPSPIVTEIGDGSVIHGEGWTLRCAAVTHAQPYLESYGFRLDCPEGSFAYSGDAGPSPAFQRLIEGCDVLVHMCHQISGTISGKQWLRGAAGHREAAEIARNAGVRTLVLSHIPSQMDVPGVREHLICEMGRIFDGHIIWGEDLMTINVSGPESIPHKG